MKAYVKQAPFMRLVIPLIIGILLQENCLFSATLIIGLIISFTTLIIVHHHLPLKTRFFTEAYYGITLILLIVTIGIGLHILHTNNKTNIKSDQILRIGEVIEIPKKKENSYETVIKLKAEQKNRNWHQKQANILTYVEKEDEKCSLIPGDFIVFNSYINPVKNTGNPFEFNYKKYLSIHGIHYQTYISSTNYKKVTAPGDISILSHANRVRMNLIDQLKASGVQEQQLAICSALTLGYKDLLNRKTRANFTNSGVIHVLAVSGLHVGLIFILCNTSLFFLERNTIARIFKTILIIVILCGYALLTGLSPSVTRATLMFGIIAIGKITQQKSSVYNSLACSAFLMLLSNPFILFSLGFQLSYCAVLSIVFFQPKIYRWFSFSSIPDKLWQLLSVALAAQIGTAPLVIHYFHQFPNYFWLSNFVAIPAATIIINSGVIIFITHSIFFSVSEYVGTALNWFTEKLNTILHLIQELPYSITSDLHLESLEVHLAYVLISLFTLFLIKRQAKAFIFTLIFLSIFIGFNVTRSIQNSRNSEFIVYNIRNHSVYNYIEGKNNLLLTGNKPPDKKDLLFSAENIWLKRNLDAPKKIRFENNNQPQSFKNIWRTEHFLYIRGIRICRIPNGELKRYTAHKKLAVDYLILSNDADIPLKNLEQAFHFKKIIIDSSNSYYKAKQWIKYFKQHSIPYHSVEEDGAFHLRFS